MFPCFPTRGNIVAETKFATREAKMFPSEFRNIDVSLCFSLTFPSVCPLLETWRNIGRKHCFRNNVSYFAHGFRGNKLILLIRDISRLTWQFINIMSYRSFFKVSFQLRLDFFKMRSDLRTWFPTFLHNFITSKTNTTPHKCARLKKVDAYLTGAIIIECSVYIGTRGSCRLERSVWLLEYVQCGSSLLVVVVGDDDSDDDDGDNHDNEGSKSGDTGEDSVYIRWFY